MRQTLIALCMLTTGCLSFQAVKAQEQELEQLVLNIEKLLQFRQILSDMKQGYEVLTQAYQMVTDISQGNFSLHQLFLDGLLEASPAVKKYERIAQLIDMQAQIVREYKAAFKRFQSSNLFEVHELQYIERVYAQLFTASLQHVSDLTTILTAGKLRMSDEERLNAIDGLYNDISDELLFLRRFNNSTTVLLLQREKEEDDVKGLRRMFR
jgi:DNA repair ATPase RecN